MSRKAFSKIGFSSIFHAEVDEALVDLVCLILQIRDCLNIDFKCNSTSASPAGELFCNPAPFTFGPTLIHQNKTSTSN
jgi:hypothetical protein